VFVQDFQIVDRPYEEAVERLRADPKGLLTEALGAARVEGEHLWPRVGPPGWPAALAKTVEIGLGPIRVHGDTTLLAFTWDSPGAPSLFPHFDADLEVAPLGIQRTEVVIRARYDPPGGVIGRGADRLVFHRISDSMVRAFLLKVCAGLGGKAADG